MKLKEAINPETIDARLEKYRKPVESKLKGDVGKYILSLEMILDVLAKSSSKSDAEFSALMREVERNVSRMTGGGTSKKGAKKGTSEPTGAPERGAGDPSKDVPSLSSLVSSEPTTPPPVPSGTKDPGSRLRKPAEKKPTQKGGDSWRDWMKKQREKDAEGEKDVGWKPTKFPSPKTKQSDQEVDRQIRKKDKEKNKFWDRF